MNEETNTLELLTIDQPVYSRMQENSHYGVWEVVLVSDEIDRYNTKINPRGFVGTPSTTSIFYNHGGASTGAVLKNVRVEINYATGEFVNDRELIIPECCVGEIHVPKTAQMNFRAKDGTVQSAGNLYEAMSNNQLTKVSVGFNPVKGKITENGKETVYNLRSPLMSREFNSKLKQGLHGEYTEWELPELSPLDINSGQAHSKIKRIRSMDTTNNNLMSYKKGDQLSRKATIMSEAVEKDGKRLYSVSIDDGEEMEMDETELERMFGKSVPKVEQKPAEAKPEAKTKRSEEEQNDLIRSLQGVVQELSAQVSQITEKLNRSSEAEDKPKLTEDKTETENQPKPETNPTPEPSAEEQDKELARKLEESSLLSKLIRKNPELLNQIEDEAEKAKYARSLNLQTPKPSPSKEPAAQFESGEVSNKDYRPEDFQRDLKNLKLTIKK